MYFNTVLEPSPSLSLLRKDDNGRLRATHCGRQPAGPPLGKGFQAVRYPAAALQPKLSDVDQNLRLPR